MMFRPLDMTCTAGQSLILIPYNQTQRYCPYICVSAACDIEVWPTPVVCVLGGTMTTMYGFLCDLTCCTGMTQS